MQPMLTNMLAAARRDQFLAAAQARRRAFEARPRPPRLTFSMRSFRAVILRAGAGAGRPLEAAHSA